MENIFAQSLQAHESFYAVLSMGNLPDVLKTLFKEAIPPVWNLSEWLLFNTLGKNEVYIRGLSIMFFGGACLFTYKIGSFLWGKKTGLWSGLLTILNPYLLSHAIKGEYYSSLCLGITASYYFFFRFYYNEERVRRRDKFGYLFSTLWALYSHHHALLAVGIQLLLSLYELVLGRRSRAKRMLKILVLTGVFYIPWLITLYNKESAAGMFTSFSAHDSKLNGLISNFLTGNYEDNQTKLLVLNVATSQIQPYLIFAVLIFRKWWKGIKKTISILMWLLIPVYVVQLVSRYVRLTTPDLYLIYTIPAFSLILASLRSRLSFIPLTALTALFLFTDIKLFTQPKGFFFREFSDIIKNEMKGGDLLINSPGPNHHYWESVFYGVRAPVYKPDDGSNFSTLEPKAIGSPDIIKEIPDKTERVGIITSGPIDEVKIHGYTECRMKEYKGLFLIWYEKG